MKFAGYVAWIVIYKPCKFGEKICYNSRDIEFFLGGYFFLAHPVHGLVCRVIDDDDDDDDDDDL